MAIGGKTNSKRALIADCGPVVYPREGLDPLIGMAAFGEIMGVKDDEAVAIFGIEEGGAAAGRPPVAVALQEHGSAAVHHGRAIFIDKGTVGAGGTSDGLLVVIAGRV